MKKTKKKNTKAKKKNTKTKINIRNEIIGLSIVALSLIMGLSLYSNQGGIIGKALKSFFLGIIGISSFLLPILSLLIGLAVLRKNMTYVHKYKLLVLSFLINISVLAHVVYYGQALKSEFSFTIFTLDYYKGAQWNTGGLLGSILGNSLLTLVGLYGSYIVLITILVILSIMVTGISYMDIIEGVLTFISDKVLTIRQNFIKKRKEKEKKRNSK